MWDVWLVLSVMCLVVAGIFCGAGIVYDKPKLVISATVLCTLGAFLVVISAYTQGT